MTRVLELNEQAAVVGSISRLRGLSSSAADRLSFAVCRASRDDVDAVINAQAVLRHVAEVLAALDARLFNLGFRS